MYIVLKRKPESNTWFYATSKPLATRATAEKWVTEHSIAGWSYYIGSFDAIGPAIHL